MKRIFILPLAAVVLLSAVSRAADVDFAKVDRRIARLPGFIAEKQLYGLLVFGPDGGTRVWAVLDKSKRDLPTYDVLYLDLNCDGDLTNAGERFLGKPDQYSQPGHERIAFAVGQFKEPGTDRTHSDFKITWTAPRVAYTMKWLGGEVTMGPYPTDSDRYLNFSHSPETAPVFAPGNDGPFRFQHWLSGTLKRGGETDFKVFMGNPGSVPGGFSCVDDKFLPSGDYVVATVIYKDTAGRGRSERFDLKSRC